MEAARKCSKHAPQITLRRAGPWTDRRPEHTPNYSTHTPTSICLGSFERRHSDKHRLILAILGQAVRAWAEFGRVLRRVDRVWPDLASFFPNLVDGARTLLTAIVVRVVLGASVPGTQAGESMCLSMCCVDIRSSSVCRVYHRRPFANIRARRGGASPRHKGTGYLQDAIPLHATLLRLPGPPRAAQHSGRAIAGMWSRRIGHAARRSVARWQVVAPLWDRAPRHGGGLCAAALWRPGFTLRSRAAQMNAARLVLACLRQQLLVVEV